MTFDTLNNAPCLLPQVGDTSCTTTPPLVNEEGQLFLRPEVAVVEVLGSVQYRTFLIANGVEMEVTTGLAYSSANYGIAVIGAIGGNATGVAEGIVTIGVTWQGLEAFAQLQVVVTCDNVSNGLMVVIDRSESMSQAFGFGQGTKLDFAKLLAKQFIGEVDIRKDTVGLVQFGTDAQLLEPLTADNVAVATTLMGIQFVPGETDITSGLQMAINNLTGVDRRVIVLFTDGGHNDDLDPLQIAYQFRSGGGVIIVVALRDGPAAFMLMEKVASGGFFMSAYDAATAADAKGYISGLKGYLCAGNCAPEGDAFIGQGALNYNDWLNWDVVSGHVDLIGNGFFDLVPGNGLFMDLVGSSAAYQGFVSTKADFTFTAGHNYRLTYKLAGNQRADAAPFSVRVIAGSSNVLRQMNDWRQDFTSYADTFAGDGSTGKISFLQESIPADSAATAFGVLLDSVMLEDTTDDVLLFYDSFDNENLTYIQPKCGAGTVYGQGYGGGYAYGYSCYGYGCLAEPIKAQHPDPNPPQDIEAENPPPVFVSTQSYTASCPVGTTGADVTRSATYTSLISLADANARALALAKALAEAALTCVNPPAEGDLINLHAVIGGTSPKTGPAAFGLGAADFWNPFAYNSSLKKSDGSAAMVYLRNVTFTSVVDGFVFAGSNKTVQLDHADPMYSSGLAFHYDGLPDVQKAEGIFFDGLELGTYDIYIYGHGKLSANNSGLYNVYTGTITGTPPVFDFDVGTQTVVGTAGTSQIEPPLPGNYLESAWAQGVQYVKFSATIIAGQTGILIVVIPAFGSNESVLMGVQIVKTS